MPDPSAGADRPRLRRRRQQQLSVCIIACKDLSLNMRTIRQAGSLARAGHDVTVIGFRTPDAQLLAGAAETVTLVATGTPRTPIVLMNQLWGTHHILRNDEEVRRCAAAAVAAGRNRNGVFARRAVNRLADRRFDIVQAHFDKALVAASLLARRCGARLAFDAVEVPFDDELLPKPALERVLRRAEIAQEIAIARRADGWITVNESLADTVVARFGVARPLVLRNVQDDGYQSSDGRLRADLDLTRDARILLHLNTMRRSEGVETAIDALAHLPAEFHLVGLGPAPEKDFVKAMRRRAAAHGVASRFHIAKLQPPHAVPAYIAGADIGIIAREGARLNLRLSLPNRLFQMIAARLPIVATPLPEIARVIRDWRVGLVFDETDPVGLAAAVRKVSEPATLAQFRGAVDRAARSLTWEQESAAYVNFIERLAEKAPAAAAAAPAQQSCRERIAGEGR